MKQLVIATMVLISVTSCAQKTKTTNNTTTEKLKTMDLSKLTNPTVKSAIEALQAHDLKVWYSHFASDAVFTDDGSKLDLKSFFDNAFNHKEKFLSIDKVENDGKNLEGNFFAGQWGIFRTYFHFTINKEGKISNLDIGQAR